MPCFIAPEISQQQVTETHPEPAETTIYTFISHLFKNHFVSLQHPRPHFLIKQTFQLQCYMHVASLSCLPHATPHNANLEIPVLLQRSSLCPRPIRRFKSSYSH